MNRRNFIRGALTGAILGVARVLPMPAAPSTEFEHFERLFNAINGPVRIYNRVTGEFEPYEPLRNELLDDLPMIEVDSKAPHRFNVNTPLPVWKER